MKRPVKKHIITIAGMLGSGKSSSAKRIASELGYAHYSAGDLMRQLGKERGIEDIRSFNIASEGKVDVDHMVDERTKKIGAEEDNVVFDGHMTGIMLPQSFRVYLTLDPNIAVHRILAGVTPERRASEHIPEHPDEYLQMLLDRQQSNVRRYEAMYGVNPYNPELYDCVIDTEGLSVEEVVERITSQYDAWLKN